MAKLSAARPSAEIETARQAVAHISAEYRLEDQPSKLLLRLWQAGLPGLDLVDLLAQGAVRLVVALCGGQPVAHGGLRGDLLPDPLAPRQDLGRLDVGGIHQEDRVFDEALLALGPMLLCQRFGSGARKRDYLDITTADRPFGGTGPNRKPPQHVCSLPSHAGMTTLDALIYLIAVGKIPGELPLRIATSACTRENVSTAWGPTSTPSRG